MNRAAAQRLMVLAMAALLAGCETYVLRGQVVRGPKSTVALVNQNDPRLAGPPIAEATVTLTLDPQTLGRKRLGHVRSDEAGRFTLPIDELGAGLLEYELGVLARAKHHQYAEDFVPLPAADQRVLIMLAPGRDTYRAPDDPMHDYERYRYK